MSTTKFTLPTNYTETVPSSDKIVSENATQTLANKTISVPQNILNFTYEIYTSSSELGDFIDTNTSSITWTSTGMPTSNMSIGNHRLQALQIGGNTYICSIRYLLYRQT